MHPPLHFFVPGRLTCVTEGAGALFLVRRIITPICESDDVGPCSAANTGANLDTLELLSGKPPINSAHRYTAKGSDLLASHETLGIVVKLVVHKQSLSLRDSEGRYP